MPEDFAAVICLITSEIGLQQKTKVLCYFSGIAIHTLLPASRLPVVNETLYPKGEILLQNLPSMVCGWVVNAKSTELILDMCAAPGNKTTHLAEMSNNQVKVYTIKIWALH